MPPTTAMAGLAWSEGLSSPSAAAEEGVEDDRGGCFLVFEGYQYAVTKEQPPARSARRPPSQEGS